MVFDTRVFVAMLALVLSSLGQTVTNVVCFGDGLNGDCTMFIEQFCGAGSLVTVSADDSVSQCFNHPDGFRCDFTAWRGATTAASGAFSAFDSDNCVPVLSTVDLECSTDESDMGGSAKMSGDEFFFTIDPNVGTCGDSTAQL